MTCSAAYLACVGLALSFIPQEIGVFFSIESNIVTTLMLQLFGALNLGFAMLNWMIRGGRIGGIYNKPIATANFMHFGVGALALLKIIFEPTTNPYFIVPITIVYTVFGIAFGYLFMNNPKDTNSQ